MTYVEIGDALLLEDKSIDPHLWIVISDPAIDPDQVVIVNLTSHDDPSKDTSCVLQAGDHPWVTDATCVRYKDARIVPEAQLDELIKNKRLRPQEPVSDEMLTKIFRGAELTELLPLKCRKILQSQGLIGLAWGTHH